MVVWSGVVVKIVVNGVLVVGVVGLEDEFV